MGLDIEVTKVAQSTITIQITGACVLTPKEPVRARDFMPSEWRNPSPKAKRTRVSAVKTDNFERLMNGLEDKVKRRIVNKALRAGADVIRRAPGGRARARPVHGPLGAAPRLAPGRRPSCVRTGPNGYPQAVIGPGKDVAHVARWVEYGHRLVRGGRSRLKGGKASGPSKQVGEVPLHPFIRPTFEATADAAAREVIEPFQSELKKRG